MKKASVGDIDDYIAQFPHDIQMILRKIHAQIREKALEATEVIN